MKNSIKNDHRKFARLDLSSKITFSIIELKKETHKPDRFKGAGKNIGVEGLQFTSKKRLKTGSLLALEISFPEQKTPVYLEGEVMWSTPIKKKAAKNKTADTSGSITGYDVGLKFLTIDKAHILMLLKYVCGSLGD